MNVWFDLSNSPHVNMFAALIRELQAEGHRVVITCRPLANTIDLLDLHGLKYTVVGEHYGGKLWKKVYGFPIRVLQLVRHLKPLGIDVAISQSSFHSPLVARLLGVRSIYMNDNEHAMGNVPSFLFATTILVPEYLSARALRSQMADPRKVVNYPGVKEGLYLWELQERLDASARARPPRARPSVYVRPEPWTAQYYKGGRDFLDDVLLGIAPHADVTVLPRGREQGAHYRDARFAALRVIDTALDIEAIARDCDLFVGAGGTMTREMAVLGTPTVSVYQDELLAVDRHLVEAGMFLHRPRLTAAELLAHLDAVTRQPPNRELLDKGRQAYALVKRAVLGA